jgi:hypothetical protein
MLRGNKHGNEMVLASAGILAHLLGPAGVGKLTIARELGPRLLARVVDNHWINNPVLALLDSDRVSPYPVAVWQEIDKVRSAVLETIVQVSPPGANYIFTNELYDDDPEDRAIVDTVMDAARRRNSPYVPIRLQCAAPELAKRIVMPERALRLKSMNSHVAHRNAQRPVIITGSPHELTLDTTDLAPAATAERIAAHIAQVRARL